MLNSCTVRNVEAKDTFFFSIPKLNKAEKIGHWLDFKV